MDTNDTTKTDIEELDRMEFEVFKKYCQPMMKELIELQELRASVPETEVGVVKKMGDELNSLKQGLEELKNMVSNMMRPQQMPQQPMNTSMPYNPGLSHIPLYRSGQSYVVSPLTQNNQ